MNNVSLPREVVNQVLEALEIGWSITYTGKDARELGMKAITALRAAMAQEQCEPVQDPVGQILPDWSTEKECIDGTCVYLNANGKNLPVNTLLYTAPSQRKPLPLKDVERLIYENTKINPNVADDKELLGYIVNAIRAVERAHNIVE